MNDPRHDRDDRKPQDEHEQEDGLPTPVPTPDPKRDQGVDPSRHQDPSQPPADEGDLEA